MLPNVTIESLAIIIAVILISLTVHEAAHAFTAHMLGDTTAKDEGRLTLNPFKHVDLFMTVLLPVVLLMLRLPPILIAKPVPFNPERVKGGDYGAALVAIAGPFSNFLLAVVGALALRFTGLSNLSFLGASLELFVYLNLIFFVFNMIPFPPLDGSRLLYAFAPDGLRRIMVQIESAGLLALVIFLLLFIPFVGPVIQNITNSISLFLIG